MPILPMVEESSSSPFLLYTPSIPSYQLENAKTLKPYINHRQKQVQLVPIFQQRNPNKTRNYIAQSMHTAQYMSDHTKAKQISPKIDEEYDMLRGGA